MEPFELLHKIVDVFERLSVPYLVTGSVAAIPRLGIPRLPSGEESAYSRLALMNRVGASAQFREVALLEGASGSCRRGLHWLTASPGLRMT